MQPVEVIRRAAGKTAVKVHQLVKALSGDVLSDADVWHVYTIANGLIERMDLGEMDLGEDDASSQTTASTAFSKI